MRFCHPKTIVQKAKVLEDKEISKGALGFVTRNSNATIFTFFKSNIDKRKKLKEEMNTIINSYKEHQVNEGMLKIKSINNSNTQYTIITEPIIDSLSNLHYMNLKFKGFEIYKIFMKFNTFIKYCLDKKINLTNLKLSDIYLTKNHELKLLSIHYDTEILHKIKKEKFSDVNNNKKTNISLLIGTIMYYLYYNEIPKNNETKFPEPNHFKEVLKYCLNSSTKFDFNEYTNKPFFNPDIIFPNHTKENIKLIERYKEYKPNEGNMSPDCQELYFVLNKIKHSDNLHDYDYFYSIYSSFDKSKILEEKYLYKQHDPKLFKLKTEKNKNIYVLAFYQKTFIIKKNSNDTFSITQEIKTDFKKFIELSNGHLAVIEGNKIIIYNKNSEDKFDIKLTLNDISAKFLFETSENYLSVEAYEQSALYDIKSFKKIKESKGKDCKEIYLNEKIKIKENGSGTGIYHEFFEEEIFNFKHENILCVTKKKDGTYLLGGYYNYIYQIYFDKYGFVELLSKIDSGYGYYEDDLSGDCIYSIPDSRYYSVGFIEECENGNILTISDYEEIKKMWKL